MQKTDWKSTRLMAIACAFALAFSMMALVACGSSGASSAASSAASDASASASEASESASAESAASESASAESAASEAASSESAEAAEPAEAKTQSGTVTTSLDMTGYEAGKVVRAWVPVPTNGDYQVISDEAIVADGATKAEMTEDELGNKMAYIEWDASVDPAVRKADVSFHAVRTEALRPDLSAESGEIPAEISEKYLGSSKMVATEDPAVVALAEEITAGKTTCVDKAQAIYDWIYDNMERDNDVVGCGDGDVCRLITEDQRAGKCTDIGSVFIALCRASGVPANEMFGIRMNADDITGNQHCWVEFYAPGIGWVPVDIADVLKAVLNDQLDKASAEALEKKDYYWGQWDEKRVEYSQGRDLVLSPAQDGAELNDFGYPYAEVDGEAIDFYKPAEFIYSVAFVTDAAAEAAAYASTIEVKDTDIEKQNISADDLLSIVEGKDDSVVILDLRNADDVKASTIEGAIPASMQKAVEEGDYTDAVKNLAFALKGATGSETGADKQIVLVCYTGNKYAQAATDALNAMGADLSKVFTLEGGAKGWAEAGMPMIP